MKRVTSFASSSEVAERSEKGIHYCVRHGLTVNDPDNKILRRDHSSPATYDRVRGLAPVVS